MADKEQNSERENEYIAALLKKLLATIGQSGEQPEETSEERPGEETSAETHVPPSPAEEQSFAPTDSSSDEPATADEVSAFEEAELREKTAPAPAVPLSAAPSPKADTSDKEAPLSAVPLSSEKSFGRRKKIKQKSAESSASAKPSAPDKISSRETSAPREEVEAPTGASYARTVLPGDPRFSGRNTAGRYLDFDLAESSDAAISRAGAIPTEGTSFAPEVSSMGEGQNASPSDNAAPADAPAPNGISRYAPTIPADMGESADAFLPVPDVAPEGDTAMPIPDADQDPLEFPSIWDTLPPIPESPVPNVPSTDDVPDSSEISSAEQAQEESTGSPRHASKKARRSWSDIDFTVATERGILVDKILEPSQDLAEEGEASLERQMSLWKRELRKKYSGVRFRTILCGACLVFAILFELIPAISGTVLSRLLLTRVPGAAHLIDLQILLLAALFGVGQILRGFEAIRFRRVIPETLVSFGFLVTLGGSIYLTIADFSGLYFCALPAVLLIFISLLSDCFRLRSLHDAFESYTAKAHHFCAVYSDVAEHPLLASRFSDAANRNLFETASVSRIDGFVDAARRRVECRRASWISLAIAGAASLFSLVISLITSDGALAIVWGMVLSFTGVMPLALFGVHRFLFSMLSSRVSHERVGIAEEETVFRDAHTGVMTFEDAEAFPAGSVRLSGIKLCGDFRLDKALYLTASVFDSVGGPLNGVFRVSTSDINISDNVEIRELCDTGIDARVNHDDVLIGTKAFLESRGVSVFRDVEDDRAEQGRTRVLYLSYMGCLSAKFHVSYEMSDAFESNVEYYAKHGIASAILTADPLLDRAFLDRVSYISEYDVRVVKKTKDTLREEEPKPHEATLITYGPRKTLRRMPFFFGIYGRYQSIAVCIMMFLTALCGAVIPLLLHFLPGAIPWLPVVVQAAGLIPCVVFGLLIQRLNPNK